MIPRTFYNAASVVSIPVEVIDYDPDGVLMVSDMVVTLFDPSGAEVWTREYPTDAEQFEVDEDSATVKVLIDANGFDPGHYRVRIDATGAIVGRWWHRFEILRERFSTP